MKLRKIGGIWWLALGRLRISWCLTRPRYATVFKPRREMKFFKTAQ